MTELDIPRSSYSNGDVNDVGRSLTTACRQVNDRFQPRFVVHFVPAGQKLKVWHLNLCSTTPLYLPADSSIQPGDMIRFAATSGSVIIYPVTGKIRNASLIATSGTCVELIFDGTNWW